MIKSMTGFGMSDLVLGAFHLRVEIRSVNSKFCDVKVKTPANLSWMEGKIQQAVRDKFARGHIEVFLFRDAVSSTQPGGVKVNWPLAEEYYKAFQSIRHKFGINQDVNLSMMTNAKEVVTLAQEDENQESTWMKTSDSLDVALSGVLEMRETEGKAMAMDLAQRCNILQRLTKEIGEHAPEVVENYRKRLTEKIASINSEDIDDTRLSQEVCYFADRCDITEEITRLKSHFQQFLSFLDSEEPVGRKMDFLVQEMNREANTIGSKSNSASISQQVVEMKSELEKLREQIQNIE